MTDTTILGHDPVSAPELAGSARRVLARAIPLAALAALGLMHFALDGLTSVVVTLQPVLADRIGARPATLGLIVATALATASLLQPIAARLVHRLGERAVAATGAVLAAVGYGSIPAATSVALTIAAVLVGGLGSALFHPAAGALVARTAESGREALPLAAFSAVGTAGTALVPLAVLTSVEGLGWAAAAPVGIALVALSAATRAPMFRPRPGHGKNPHTIGQRAGQVRPAVLAAAVIALSGITVGASAPVLMAQVYGRSHPAVAWVVAAYSASGAAGGMALAVWARRAGVRRVLLTAVAMGTVAAAAVPSLPAMWAFPAVVVAGAGLSGSLPLLVGHARRPGEASAAGAVGRILGLGAGLGGAGYAGVGLLQSSVGYGVALTGVVAVAGTVALATGWFLCRSVDPSDCHDILSTATTACPCGSCSCTPHPPLPGTGSVRHVRGR